MRVYERKFDWEKARRLREEGRTYREVARLLGVSVTAIRFACVPGEYERARELQREWQHSGVCCDCGAPCSQNRKNVKDHPPRCRACASRAQTKMTDTHAWCFGCKEWKTHDQFQRDNSRYRTLKGRCRPCESAARRDYRERHREEDRAYNRARYHRRKAAAGD